MLHDRPQSPVLPIDKNKRSSGLAPLAALRRYEYIGSRKTAFGKIPRQVIIRSRSGAFQAPSHSAMQFRRSGQRNDRRRRVLSDCLSNSRSRPRSGRAAGSNALANGDQVMRKSENYGDAEFLDRQPKLTDLVPTNLAVFLMMFLVGLAIVAGLEVLYAWMPKVAALTRDGSVATIDLDSEGSLAVWFSSMTLALAGLVAILVFTIRRHKKDDYQGIYRIWLWAAACWFLLSIDETASLHEGFKEMMTCVTGTRVLAGGDGSIWWVIAYVFLLGAVGTRLLIDMRHCRLSLLAMIATATCYVTAVAAQLGWVLPESGARGIMLEEGAEMVGNLFLLLAMGLHARYVILDAEGLLPERANKEDEDEDEYEIDYEAEIAILKNSRAVKVHPPHGLRRPSKTHKPSRATTPAEVAALNPPTNRKLTKGEKKALRRRLEKMRRERGMD